MRAALAGLAGGLAWRLGLTVIFGPAQAILADPQRRSAKMLAAFSFEPPDPRMYEAPWLVWAALLGLGLVYGWAYASVARAWQVGWWGRGVRFGLLAWALMVPWFEFCLPFNVLREPAPPVALETQCWAGVMQCVGLSIAGIDRALEALGHCPAA